MFTLRRFDVPVLAAGRRAAAGAAPVRPAHDARPAPQAGLGGRRWPALDPDLVVVTGDNMAHADAVPGGDAGARRRCWTTPGAFVFGSNDYTRPGVQEPASAYFNRDREYVQGVDAAVRGAAGRCSPAPAGPT